MPSQALIMVDIQNDFMPGGNLAVPDGHTIVPVVNRLSQHAPLCVATQDWHPSDHLSFASQHARKVPFETIDLNGIEQTLWPDHCCQNTSGAEFHPNLAMGPVQAIFRKGMDRYVDSYSGFYDNQHAHSTGLAGYLKTLGVNHVFITGLCADICVYYTLKDALSAGFECCLIEDATKALDLTAYQTIKTNLIQQGVEFINAATALDRFNQHQ